MIFYFWPFECWPGSPHWGWATDSVHCSTLTHWGRVTHICVGNLTSIGSDNGLSPGQRQAIIWTNAGLLLIGPLGTNFSEILIEILTFSFKKMRLKVSSAKRRPSCLGLNVLTHLSLDKMAAMSQTIFSDAFSWMNLLFILIIKVSLKFVLKGPINNNPALVYIMAWCWIG